MSFKKMVNKFLVRMMAPDEEVEEEVDEGNGKKKTVYRKRSSVKASGKFKDVKRAFSKGPGKLMFHGLGDRIFDKDHDEDDLLRFPMALKRKKRRMMGDE